MARAIISDFIDKTQPIAIAFASEGWTITAEDKEKLDVAPSQHPNKEEILYINFETKDLCAHHSWGIKRDAEGKNPVITEKYRDDWHRKTSTESQGNFTNLIGTPESTEEEQIANKILNEEE